MVVIKSAGITESEHRLVKLGERVFMGLWSYPNPVIKTGNGFRELCDLLVICGNTVLVFSDKHIKFNDNKDIIVAWQRWERKAITNSIHQLHHAENIIRDHPDMIWLNATQRLPISIPSKEDLQIHLICIANGATEACKQFFGSGCSGSLKFSNITSAKSVSNDVYQSLPEDKRKDYLSNYLFTTHDYDVTKTFIHIFDDYSFPFVLTELDTLTDFVRYLSKKEAFIRNQPLMYTGEEDLLFRYLHNFDDRHKCHDFLSAEDKQKNIALCCFCEEDWDEFKKTREYLSNIRENRVSYFWDNLVQSTAFCALNDITQTILRSNPCDKDVALRYMAMEDRLSRRIFAKTMLNSIKNCEPDQIRMTAFMSSTTLGLLYIFLQMDSLRFNTYTEYLDYRRQVLSSYIYFAKAKCTSENIDINKIVGIVIEPPKHREVSGTDFVYMEFRGWPKEQQEYWDKERIKHGVFRQSISQWTHSTDKEWPDADKPRKIGVNEKCPCGSGKKYKKCCGSVLKVGCVSTDNRLSID